MKYKFKPYSRNIIFFDTEFSSLDPYKGEILSIGLVKLDGKELYLEIGYKGKVDPWVEENIIPTLKDKKVSRKEAVRRVKKFIGKRQPYLVAYVNQYDVIYWKKLLGRGEDIFYWLPVDFASILFGIGIDPEAYYLEDKKNFFEKIGVDKAKFKHTHNALEDARLLREVYLKMSGL